MHTSSDDSLLRVESLSARAGTFSLENISLSCLRGDFHILMGPTGSGKSTLMKCLLGLKRVNRGRIVLNQRDITAELPERRRMGYVPQNYALFPHLDVEQNLTFGLKAGRTTRREAAGLVDELCNLMGIAHLRGRRVQGLSGGERQRVAIGRALAVQPEILLLDEPFSSIDEGTKRNLWLELKRIVKKIGITALHITHNLEEAYTLGEHVSVLMAGKLVQTGSRREVFERPIAESVARFLNYRNIFRGVAGEDPRGSRIDMGHFSVRIEQRMRKGETVHVCIRPVDIKLLKEGKPLKGSLRRNTYSGRVVSLYSLPDSCIMHFATDGSPHLYDFELKFPPHISLRHELYPGKPLRVAFWEPSIIVFRTPADS
jgi:ABC-type Fe3+/spermidine/putrescine transport system ATPase subunit